LYRFKTTALAGAALLALSAPAAHAQSNAQLKKEIEELRKQVQQLLAAQPKPAAPAVDPKEVTDLRKQVNDLQAQVKKKDATDAAAARAAAPAADADQATVDAATPATKADIQGVRADFENYKYETARNFERKVPSVIRNTTIGGTVQARASWANPAANAGQQVNGGTGSNTTAAATPRHTSFDIPSVTLSFAGNLYRDYNEGKNLTYQLGFSTATNFGNSTAQTNLGSASPNGSQVNLTNANLAYSFFPTNGGLEDPKGTLTFGQQLVPFGLEAQANEEIRPVINSAQFTAALSGINTRQIGLIYRGDAFVNVDYTNNYRSTLFEYAFGVVNGSGPNKSDNNGRKDWLARAAFTLPADYNSWLRELKIGASYYRGYNNLSTGTSVNQVVRGNRTGFDVNYTHLPFSIAYEFAQGLDDVATAGTTLGPGSPLTTKKARGQYINVGYTWGEQFLASEKSLAKYDDYWPKSYQAFLRLDKYDADVTAGVRGDETFISTLGLNAFFAETTKLQFNYLRIRNDQPTTGYTSMRPQKGQGVQVQFQYGF
jgi:hypothetical protein